jgi:formylglycine-generating enzyme required for sulfatase activity
MNRTFSFVVSALFAATVGAATVSDVKIKQLWPWSTDVKLTFTLSDVTGPTDITIRCFDGDTEITAPNLHNSVKGDDLYGITADGVRTVTIDPVKAFGSSAGSFADFNVELTAAASSGNPSEVIYKIFDLNEKTCTDVTRADILNRKYGDYETDFARIGEGFNTTLSNVLIWTAVTNGTEYKTDKLVMRKIPAKDVLWTIGSPEGETGRDYDAEDGRETQHTVKLTEDYFIAVFEMTQYQAEKVFPAINTLKDSRCYFDGLPDSDVRPYTGLSFNNIRGQTGWGISKADSYPKVNWPTNSPMHAVFSGRLAGSMRSMLSVDFDLPTEAQWEFACRAGTTTALNSGKNVSTVANGGRCANVDELGWTLHSDYSDADGGTNQTREVGLKKPNAFGLYDMHGNAEEFCLDRFGYDISVFYDGTADAEHSDPLVDPVGRAPVDGNPARTTRGGSWRENNRYIRSGYRCGYWQQTHSWSYLGFRMVCPASADGWAK